MISSELVSWWSRYRLTAIWTSPDGREGSGACGAVGIGTEAVLSSIPEG